jgi:3-deoxy-D-manno-octulosonic-acid transferase
MDDFVDEKNLLEEAGAGITIGNGDELLEGIRALLEDPESLSRKGEEGRKSVVSNMGASRRYAEMIGKNIS